MVLLLPSILRARLRLVMTPVRQTAEGSCNVLLLFAEFLSSSLVRQAQGDCLFQSHIHSDNCRILSQNLVSHTAVHERARQFLSIKVVWEPELNPACFVKRLYLI
jgi:hypothetical protein